MTSLLLPGGPQIWNPRMPSGLRDGLLFAGVGEHPGGLHCHDSSEGERHGTLTGYADPAAVWAWDSDMQRWAIQLIRSAGAPYKYVSIPCALSSPYTISLWLWLNATQPGTYPTWVHSGTAIQYGRQFPAGNDFIASGQFLAAAYATPSAWMHLTYTSSGSAVSIYKNGVFGESKAYAPAGVASFNLNRSDSYGADGFAAQVTAHSRILDPAEIDWLAQRENTFLVPWRRKSWLVGAAAPSTFTAAAALETSSQTLAATATHTAPSFTAAATLTMGLQTLAAAATFAPGTKTAAADLVASSQTLAASATFAPGTKTAAAAMVASGQTLAATATHTPPSFTAEAALAMSSQTLAASATSVEPTFTAAATLANTAQTVAASATFTAPVYTAAAAFEATSQVLAAVATHTPPTFTAAAALAVTSQTLAAAAQFTPPVYTASADLIITSQVLAAAVEAPILWYADTLRLFEGATEVRHLAVRGTLPGVVPLLAAARNGPGTASLRYTTAGLIQYLAPGSATWGQAIAAVMPAAIPDDTWIVRDGADPDKWLRIQVYADYLPAAAATVDVELVDVFNFPIGQDNCAAADALAGEVISWEIACTNVGSVVGTDGDITSLTWWLTQPAAGTIEISHDGVTWVSPTTEGTGLVLGTVATDASATLHVRRTIAPGAAAAPSLLTQLHASFTYWGETYYLDARGRFRVFNAAGYYVHFATDPAAPPAETDTPDETAASLPHTTTATFGDGIHYFALEAYNGVLDSGFAPVGSLGEEYLTLEISGGEALADRPAEPIDIQLRLEEGGVVRIEAAYMEPTAANRATQWAIAYTITGVDPLSDTPTITATVDGSAYAVLSYALPAQADGTEVRVRVQTRRNDGTDAVPDWVYSDSTVVTVEADALGPTVPLAFASQ